MTVNNHAQFPLVRRTLARSYREQDSEHTPCDTEPSLNTLSPCGLVAQMSRPYAVAATSTLMLSFGTEFLGCA